MTSSSASSVNGRKQRSGKAPLEVSTNGGGTSPEPLDKGKILKFSDRAALRD